MAKFCIYSINLSDLLSIGNQPSQHFSLWFKSLNRVTHNKIIPVELIYTDSLSIKQG